MAEFCLYSAGIFCLVLRSYYQSLLRLMFCLCISWRLDNGARRKSEAAFLRSLLVLGWRVVYCSLKRELGGRFHACYSYLSHRGAT